MVLHIASSVITNTLNSMIILCILFSTLADPTTSSNNIYFKEVVDLTEFQTCDNNGDASTEEMFLKPVGPGEVEVDGFLEFTKTIKSLSFLKFDVTQCRSKTEPETCEFASTFNIKTSPCNALLLRNQVWTSLIGNAKPPLRCPLFGRYNVTGGKLLPEYIKKFLPNAQDSFWKLSVFLFDENKIERSCFKISLAILQVRIRPRKPQKMP